MKISKIEVCDFRGFPGPAVYDFDFGTAQNLLIHGDNGSGKSSLFRAIQEFFNRDSSKAFAYYKNSLAPQLTSGKVAVHCDDGSAHTWSLGSTRPWSQLPMSEISLQVGCLDYRSLLETNFSQRGDLVDLFEIAVRHLVANRSVAIQGGGKRLIGQLWHSVQASVPAKHYPSRLQRCHNAVSAFNTGFDPLINPLVAKAQELLAKFSDPDIELALAFHPIAYDKESRRLKNKELILSVKKGGALLSDHHNVLNEARLSAIGLVIYLAGLLTSVPASSQYPKLLVLDDVLVGLDMANRMPVLQILREYFSDWQIILLTYDRIWFEMVLQDLDKEKWNAYEMWLAHDGITPVHKPRIGGGDEFFLQRSEQHLANNDDRAAGVYARAAFEVKVKNYCDKRTVPVPYQKPPKHIDSEKFWDAAKKHALEKSSNATRKAELELLFAAVDAVKKVVLNPLSHSNPQTITRAEIQAAITAVRTLAFQ